MELVYILFAPKWSKMIKKYVDINDPTVLVVWINSLLDYFHHSRRNNNFAKVSHFAIIRYGLHLYSARAQVGGWGRVAPTSFHQLANSCRSGQLAARKTTVALFYK